MLKRKMEKEGLVFPFLTFKENVKQYRKYNIRCTPVFLKFDKDGAYDTIVGMEEILKELRNLKKEGDEDSV